MESKHPGVFALMHSVMALESRCTFQNYEVEEAIMARDSLAQVLARLDKFIQCSTRPSEEVASTKMEQ